MGINDQLQNQRDIAGEDLPLDLIKSSAIVQANPRHPTKRKRILPRYFLLLLIPLILFTGAVIGIYVQPPALRIFLQWTGLKPGGGTSNPIAVPVDHIAGRSPRQSTVRSVVALGRLIPEGKVITISPPYGSGDARIEEIKIAVGSQVKRGDTLALLDNYGSLESAVLSAESNVALQKAALEQTRLTISSNLDEAKATLERAKSAAKLASQDLNRQQDLYKKGAAVQAELDQAIAVSTQALKDVTKAQATVARYEAQKIDEQPDVVVASRKLDSAITDLNRTRRDLARGIVTAPASGTILEIHARPGEKPGTKGILEIGNIRNMTAELEVYQSEIAYVAVGQQVELTADALKTSFNGLVSEIGYSVERQTMMRDDPAANTDARVIKVKVNLDEESSRRASRFTNLEVTGRIAIEAPK